jgi:protein SCO1/2
VRLADLRGKVVVLFFIYTNCPDVCPLQAEALAVVQREVNRMAMGDLVAFVAVTTDPERDTADVLRSYGAQHGLEPANFLFLTSDVERPTATRELAADYGLTFDEAEGGVQVHGVVTHLIDKSGHLRARYHGLKFDPSTMILHLNALANDDH